MAAGNVGIIESLYSHFAAGNIPAVLEAFAPDIVWNEAEGFPYSDRNPYVGPTAVIEGLFSRLGSEWDYWKVEPEELLDAGDTVVALGRYKAKHKTTGKAIDAQFVHVWKFQGDKVVRFQQYADTLQVADAVKTS